MSTKQQQRIGTSSLLVLLLAFVTAVIVTNELFRGWSLDMTEDNLYTLSDGTERILEKIDEPINLYFYFSDQASAGIPSLRTYASRVQEMLEEFEERADGKINLSIIDPLPFSEEEDRATQFGLQGVQIGATPDPIYFGLAGTDSVDNQEVIPFFQPDKEAFLEYDIARLVSTLANPERTVIGLVSGVEMTGGFDPQTQGLTPAWVVYEQANQLFEIRNLGTAFEAIPDEVSVLWIVQPKNLSNATLYAIDQFVMRGGAALVFVDPVADVDPAQAEGMPQGMPPLGQGSDLPLLFDAWGIEFPADRVVADAQLALPITTPQSPRPVRHYGFLGVSSNWMSDDDIVTGDLNVVNLATPGFIRPAEGGAATIEPLLESSESSMSMPATRFSFLPDPSILQESFTPSGERKTLAARISGTLPSAFPNGPPDDTVSSDEEPAAPEDAATDSAGADDGESDAHLAESAQPANLIVVADVDLLDNQMWVQVQNFFGQRLANAFASNGAFVINALESLAGSPDLIAVRSRGSFTRPFTRVDALRARAEAEFQETENRLQQELADTERRLRELQSSREDAGNLLLSPEQQAEIDRFIDQRADIRRELRAVQRNLDADIERLGTVLKVINIGLVPFLLTVLALFAVWRRNRRDAA
ncbi:MAG: Gldg family protein [Woeseiaceae bacterium]|nr:Gldg family protein [Woeseiaceae bacterium]